MKKFGGVRSLGDLKKKAIESGWKVDEKAYHEKHSDYVFLHEKTDNDVVVAVNTFNGHFFVYNRVTDENLATHLSAEFDNGPWYSEILNIINKPSKSQTEGAL
ncbi:MAG: hypothetical protein ACQEUS_20820 [Bacillota bacterium]